MDNIIIGSIVTIFDRETQVQCTYRIVEGMTKNKGELSNNSALGKALMYARCSDTVTVRAEEEYRVDILAVDNSQVKKILSFMKPIAGRLVRNLSKGYGTRAQDIYDCCCKQFGWDYAKRGLFAPQKPLYAKGATPEGYSPLFLAHSNWTESKGSNWSNTITEKTIEEKWDEITHDFYHDDHIRVVFAKSKKCSWNYVFIGVYKPVEYREENLPNCKTRWIKIFERISDVY